MAVFLWIWNLVSPIMLFIGLLFITLGDPDELTFILGGISAVVGLIIGIVGWGDTVPPRWFWIKSSVDLAGSRITTAISYALQFFLLPAGIMGIIEIINQI